MTDEQKAYDRWHAAIQGLTVNQRRVLVWVQGGCKAYPFPSSRTINSLIRRGLIEACYEPLRPPWVTTTIYGIMA